MKAHLFHLLLAQACKVPSCWPVSAAVAPLGGCRNAIGKCSQPHPVALSSRDLKITLASAGKGESHRGRELLKAAGWMPRLVPLLWEVLCQRFSGTGLLHTRAMTPGAFEVCSQKQEM